MLQHKGINIVGLVIISFVIGQVIAILCFRANKHGCGLLSAFIIPSVLVVIVTIIRIIYQIATWGAGTR